MANKPRNTDLPGRETTNVDAHRHPAKTQDIKGEAQNINDDTERPLNEDDLKHARNKANESKGSEDSD